MELDPQSQSQMVDALKRADAFPHPIGPVEHLQTHISHVLLAGDYAYKIKKPLDLGFLDFSSLAKRKHCCEEELRLNSRLAPSVYLEVMAITGDPAQPVLGGEGMPLDYAVRMRRFSQDALLSRRTVEPRLIDRIAERAALFHRQIPAAAEDAPYGAPEAVMFPMQQNFDQIRGLLDDPGELGRLHPLEAWTRDSYQRLQPLLSRRKAGGHIRECHGDMHLGNIALVDGEVVIFDGIEFNPNLRWIDTMNEVAFLVMDLEQAGEESLARRLLNRYLEVSGDYQGVALLDFYKVYRALVRAKVTAIRLGQPDLPADERRRVLDEYGRYVSLAERYTRPRAGSLLLTHGVSGSGKTYVGAILVESLGAVRIRSDVERKRLFGVEETGNSHSAQASGIYSATASARTYEHLRDLAAGVAAAGYPALVDATFLKRAQRRMFLDLARDAGYPLVMLDMQASDALLRERISQRRMAGGDASEADLGILDLQLANREPLSAEELALAVPCESAQPLPLQRIAALIGHA